MFRNPVMLLLDKAYLCPLQLNFCKGREIKKGKEHVSGCFGRRRKKSVKKNKVIKSDFPQPLPQTPIVSQNYLNILSLRLI